MSPVRGSVWLPSESPACAVPRKPCSGPKTPTMSTAPDSCISSTMVRRLVRMPVGLVMIPTFWPDKADHDEAAALWAPVVTGFLGDLAAYAVEPACAATEPVAVAGMATAPRAPAVSSCQRLR